MNTRMGRELVAKRVKYQIGGIIGYPVPAALGRITFYNGTLGVDVCTRPVRGRDSNLFVDEQTLLTAARIGGTALLFTFDTGIPRTILTARYYREHTSDFPSERAHQHDLAGVGGTHWLRLRRKIFFHSSSPAALRRCMTSRF